MPRPIPIRSGLLPGAPALAAEAGRVMHPGEPGIEPGAQEVQPRHGGRIVRRQEVAYLAGQVVRGQRRAGAAGAVSWPV